MYQSHVPGIIQQVTADHGPAVSGAHNTIVTARAGKDLVSALCSGLLTIGPRFGGALDKAAEMFTQVIARPLQNKFRRNENIENSTQALLKTMRKAPFLFGGASFKGGSKAA